jgi:molecular chaperone DnaJ
VSVWTPQNLSAEEKTILEKLTHSNNFKPQPDKNEKGFFDKVRDMFS